MAGGTTPGLDGYQRMQTFLSTFEGLANNLVTFLNQIDIMLEGYFDPIKRRSKDAYGFAFAQYYMNMLKNAPVFAPDITPAAATISPPARPHAPAAKLALTVKQKEKKPPALLLSRNIGGFMID